MINLAQIIQNINISVVSSKSTNYKPSCKKNPLTCTLMLNEFKTICLSQKFANCKNLTNNAMYKNLTAKKKHLERKGCVNCHFLY